MSNLPTATYTEFCRGTLSPTFSGVLYCDVGKLNYAVVVHGKALKNKRNKIRWFKYEMEAGRAAYHELQRNA